MRFVEPEGAAAEMAKKKHKPIPLSGATKILRAHSTQIDPPGLLELENLFVSRSDNAITLRSDWEAAYAGMFSYGSLIQGGDQEDYLNSAFYVTRAGHTIWLGRWAPFTWNAGEFGQLFTLYETGTITTDGVKKEAIGTGTSWHQKVWPGCLIRFKGDGNSLYAIEDVTNNTRILTNAIMPVASAVEYEIFRVHPAARAVWPMRLAALGGYLIYGTVDMSQPITEKEISGPFFANINRPNLGVWFGTDPDIDDIDMNFSVLAVASGWGPILVAGDKGSVFGRETSEPVLFYQDSHSADTKALNFGAGQETFTVLTSGTSGFALTLEGNVIDYIFPIDSPQEIRDKITFGGGFSSYYKYEKPFGNLALHGWLSNKYVVGSNGLLGEVDTFDEPPNHVIHPTGVDITLRDAAPGGWLPGGHEDSWIIVGDDDGNPDAVILDFITYNNNFQSITRKTSDVTGESLTSVASGFSDFLVAVGTGGTCITSDDGGATWTARTVGTTEDLAAVVWDTAGKRCVAVGEKVFFSLDGITWKEEDLGVSLVDVVFSANDSLFYALDENGDVWKIRIIAYIGDGSSTDMGSFGDDSDFVLDMRHDGSQFVAVGNKIWTSPDAVTWTERETPSETVVSVEKDEDGGLIWVAVGLAGTIYRSIDDGVNWVAVTSGTTEDLNCIAWTGHHTGYSNRDFVVVGKNGTVLKSPDGASWTTMNFPSNTELLAVVHNPWHSAGGESQLNLYASGIDGKIYVNYIEGGSGAYGTWEEWEHRVASISGSQPQAAFGVVGALAAYSLASPPFTNDLTAFGRQTWTHDEIRNGSFALTKAHCDIAWFTDSDAQGILYNAANNICTSGFSAVEPLTVFPVMFCRYSTLKSYWEHYLLTSIDNGVTWSTTIPAVGGVPTVGQIFTQLGTEINRLNGKVYSPICYDGTNVFIVVSSIRSAGKPFALKHSGWVIDLEEAEKI